MITHEQAMNDMRNAIKAGRPYMFARYGDGEALVLGFPERTPLHRYKARLDKWFGCAGMSMAQLRTLADNMRDSVVACDLVGIPEKRHHAMDSNWRNVDVYMKRYHLLEHGQKVCGMDAVLWIQRRKAIPALLAGVSRLCCITCRDVRKPLMAACPDLKHIEMFYLPPQRRPLLGRDMANGVKHYPNLYREVPKWLDVLCQPGQVFFIGAGGLGKIYARMVKERGGIAIDVGSLFDGWAGMMSRSHIRNEPKTWRLY